MTNILILCGPTGCGKTFIANLLSSSDIEPLLMQSGIPIFHKVMQVTTRERRDFSEYADSYSFISEEEYEDLKFNERLTAKTSFNGNKYGTLIENFIHGQNAYNIIVANAEGTADVINMYGNDKEYNIITAIVLSQSDDGMINEHCRDINIVKNEIFDLMQSPYDYYIPNYEPNRATLKKILKILGFKLRKDLV